MSYRRRGLGQAKWVPGQISFSTLPEGATALPNLQPLVERGLPIAPYIEHGSYETGEPAIMRYGLDPYRGIMGADSGCSGLGCFLSRIFGGGASAASPPQAASGSGTPGISDALRAAAASDPAGAARLMNAVGQGTVECAGQVVYRGDAVSAMAYAGEHARRNRIACVARLTGTPRGDDTVYAASDGRLSRRAPTGTSGMGQSVLTEYACSESALTAAWQERQRATLASARNASMVAGALVGGLGAVAAEKNPFFGALGGAAAAFLVQQVWLAPYST